MIRSAMARMGASCARSVRMLLAMERLAPSGWGRRVSLKRRTMAASSASRKINCMASDFLMAAKALGKRFSPSPSRISTTSAAAGMLVLSRVSSANLGIRSTGRLSTE